MKAHLSVDDGQAIKSGQIIAKIPLASSLGDITGGLPRVTELSKHVIHLIQLLLLKLMVSLLLVQKLSVVTKK